MVRVLVDLLFYTGKRGGTETVAREVYGRLSDASGFEFIGLASKELASLGAPWFPGRVIDSGLRTTSQLQWTRGEQTLVSALARRESADVIHSPANYGPMRTATPLVLTLHDMLPFRRPDFMPNRFTAAPSRLLIAAAARAAAHVATDSDDAKRDIHELLGLADDRVSVVRPGSPGLSPSPDGGRSTNRLFSLGNRMPHKNFPRLIEAISRISPERRPTVTISGSHGEDPLLADARRWGVEASVDLRGWLTREEIEDLYATSTAIVFPTLFEGFGLPVLEAMERGCPVLCSDIPVLREVGGEAALYFDPLDPGSIARAIERVMTEATLRASQAEAGYAQAQKFSWDDSAGQMLDIFSRTAA